jgi:hypothetical protein
MISQDLEKKNKSELDLFSQQVIPQEIHSTRFKVGKTFTLRFLDIRHCKIKDVTGEAYKTKYLVMLGSPRYDYLDLYLFHNLMYEFNFPLNIFNYAWQSYHTPSERMMKADSDYDVEITFKRVNKKRFEFIKIKLFERDENGNSDIWKIEGVTE